MTFDTQLIAQKWREDGFDCTPHTDAPSQEWQDLIDPRDERVRVLSGELEVTIEGEVHLIKAGEEILISGGTRHGSRVLSQVPVELLYGYTKDAED